MMSSLNDRLQLERLAQSPASATWAKVCVCVTALDQGVIVIESAMVCVFVCEPD